MFKKGDLVKTRGGYPARIIADNIKNNHGEELAVVVTWEDEEYLMRYPVDGEPSRYEVWKLTDDEELTPSFHLVHIEVDRPYKVFFIYAESRTQERYEFCSYSNKIDAENTAKELGNIGEYVAYVKYPDA